jgi:hypothetical protein
VADAESAASGRITGVGRRRKRLVGFAAIVTRNHTRRDQRKFESPLPTDARALLRVHPVAIPPRLRQGRETTGRMARRTKTSVWDSNWLTPSKSHQIRDFAGSAACGGEASEDRWKIRTEKNGGQTVDLVDSGNWRSVWDDFRNWWTSTSALRATVDNLR